MNLSKGFNVLIEIGQYNILSKIFQLPSGIPGKPVFDYFLFGFHEEILPVISIFMPIYTIMQPLNLPTYSFNLKSREGRPWIFDEFRRSWYLLTPEEWVRQNFARYLCDGLGYPESLLLLEGKITHNTLTRRCDIVVFNRKGLPVILVECKAPEVVLNQKTFDQISRYNMVLGVRILLVTNGLSHYCIRLDPETGTYSFLKEIPSFLSIADQSSEVI
jgi:hypothetical protein